ncbi:thiosulfate oxidation carrier protein SoxY [Achromobacter sp. SD115]|uniref:Thiosulfate oxidation carrier protein SoxY n=1 Tax=Achromobacter pestifer TaxID=1353889 RepID=A0A7D4EC93_9BURK|nr:MULTISPECIES: thiosulfate oxidation carrier protein SoxY [Achromobacter]MBO1018163.1 thiosulfate oxidation carrier protein SoxY [Achromobacter sp. SD115]QKH39746.1 thiosulfate oxidation carrier protein SoxY [Achromobacter pestifer]
MDRQRRKVVGLGTVLSLAVAAGLLRPSQAWAVQADWNKQAFDAKSMQDVIKALGGGDAVASDQITLVAPDIAENGAVVPVGAVSKLPNTEQISILVTKNPNALAASFTLPAGTEPEVATRVKMGQTSDVYALVKADGKYYTAHKEIKVTLGGCGG